MTKIGEFMERADLSEDVLNEMLKGLKETYNDKISICLIGVSMNALL